MQAAGQSCFRFIQDHGSRLMSGKPIGNKNEADVDVKASACSRLTSLGYLLLFTLPAGLVGCMLTFPSLVGRCCCCSRSKKLSGDASVGKTSDAGENILLAPIPKFKSASPRSVSEEPQSPKNKGNVQEPEDEDEAPVDPSLQERDAQIKKLEQELAEVTQQCQALRTKLTEAEKVAASNPIPVPVPPNQEAEVNSLKQQLAQKEKAHNQLLITIKNLQTQYDGLFSELNKMKKLELEAEIAKLQAQVKAHKELEDSAKGTLGSERQQLADLHKELNELHGKLQESEKNKTEIADELNENKKLFKTLEDKLEEITNIVKQTNELRNTELQKAKELENENSANKKSLDEKIAKVNELENEITQNKEELASIKEKMSACESSISMFEKLMKNKDSAYASLVEKEGQLTAQLTELREKHEKTKEENKALSKALKESMDMLQGMYDKHQKLTKEFELLKKSLSDEQEKSKQLEADNVTFANSINPLEARLQEDTEKFAALEEMVEQASHSRYEADLETEKFRQENEKLKSKTSKNEEEIEKLKAENENIKEFILNFSNETVSAIENLYKEKYQREITDTPKTLIARFKKKNAYIGGPNPDNQEPIRGVLERRIKETEKDHTQNHILKFYLWLRDQQDKIDNETYVSN